MPTSPALPHTLRMPIDRPADTPTLFKSAKAFFATINASNRYAILWRIQTAVKAETRTRRIAQLVEMLGRGEVVHIFKPKVKAKDTD
jgi:uncharacterized protein YdeI (YjbR/CyaY-like superfamily)